MKVAIIGAGTSGIAAIKCCVDEGLRPTCYERTHDIGGLWRYTDEVTEGQACVMKSTIINTSKEMMCYSDFPIPAEYPIFMHNSYVQKYFNLYVDKFELRKHIHFRHEIISVKPTDDFETSGQWILKVKDLANEEEHNITYDAVMICTGHHAEKNMPDFPGLKNFKGKVLHSHDYKHTAGYEEKRVVVVGIGNSGGDAAVELSRVASQTFLSTRSGSWVYNRISDRGLPLDMLYTRRITFALKNIIGGPIIERLAQKKLEQRFDHSIYGLKPKHGILAQHPMVNDELPNRLASGTLKLKSNIKHLTESGVVFKDGTTEDDIDVVMFATGYVFGFPFLDESVVKVVHNKMELYKYIFPPNLKRQTLCIIGCVQPLGAIMPVSEMQSRLATRVFKGDVLLPSKEEMWKDIHEKVEAMRKRYIAGTRHTIQVDWIDYMDELAVLNKCLPDLWNMLKTDPKLALACFLGPSTPYQYRLEGPGKCSGAREAIFTQWNRTLSSLKTRPLGFEGKKTGFSKFNVFCIAVMAIILYYLFVYYKI
ncbi:flavin-containing monooxygenase 5-like [Mytilus californianus]|uniref:flavin-containing monooxygenase 5-like n=1 Tax=Mytilus californianus TaxID=6549 RepID=UPI0022454878|nr:flavin-containing monooxygenase 5-like [Mytilus californianus]